MGLRSASSKLKLKLFPQFTLRSIDIIHEVIRQLTNFVYEGEPQSERLQDGSRSFYS